MPGWIRPCSMFCCAAAGRCCCHICVSLSTGHQSQQSSYDGPVSSCSLCRHPVVNTGQLTNTNYKTNNQHQPTNQPDQPADRVMCGRFAAGYSVSLDRLLAAQPRLSLGTRAATATAGSRSTPSTLPEPGGAGRGGAGRGGAGRVGTGCLPPPQRSGKILSPAAATACNN